MRIITENREQFDRVEAAVKLFDTDTISKAYIDSGRVVIEFSETNSVADISLPAGCLITGIILSPYLENLEINIGGNISLKFDIKCGYKIYPVSEKTGGISG